MGAPFMPLEGQRRPRTASSAGKRPSWRDRLAALRYIPPFLRMVYETNRGQAVGIVGLRMVRALVPLALLWVGKLIIETVEVYYRGGAAVDWAHLGALVLLEFGIAVTGEALARASALLESLLGDLFSNRTSARLMEHASRLDLAQFESAETYDHLRRARSQTVGRIGLLGQLLGTVQDVITLVSLAAALVLYVPWLLVLLSLAVLPVFLGETHFAALGYSLLFQWTPQRRKLDYLQFTAASDGLAKEVKLFRLAPFLTRRYAALADAFYEANKRLAQRRAVVSSLLAAVGALGYYGAYAVVIVLTVTGYRSPAGLFTIGVLTFLAASFHQSRNLIQRTLLALSQVYEQSLYLRDLFAFFELTPQVVSKPGAPAVPRPIREGFVFDRVGFRYPRSDAWAVRDLSFMLPPNEAVALVGENGAGKTTVVKLLTRLYDPDEGRILLDGVDLREYDVDDLWSNVGVIFQDFACYHFLLRENIAVGQIEELANEPRIMEAARRGMADRVAKRLERGYDQQLGRQFDGVELSGGEWQKVALSRAYMRNAQVLILDEPTAALDARAEYEVFRRFTELTRAKIGVVISHRFSTVRMASRILVLESGRLAQLGTHTELLTHGGPYAELFNLQAAGYR
jgi:ATP-binding cassette subfamily B protein